MDQTWASPVALYSSRYFPVQLPAARAVTLSLVPPFASISNNHVPARLARSPARPSVRPSIYLNSVVVAAAAAVLIVVSAPVFLDRVFGGVPSSREKALGISLRAEP